MNVRPTEPVAPATAIRDMSRLCVYFEYLSEGTICK